MKILKVSVIDWCYRVGRRGEDEWIEFGNSLRNIISKHDPDYIFLDRTSKCWYSDFIKYNYFENYYKTFVATASIDKRLGEGVGGSSILIREGNSKKFSRFKLPSSKSQLDGGQPTHIIHFNWNDTKILLGCMPQNLGRDGLDLSAWRNTISQFWGDGCETDAFVVPIYDKDLELYDYHFWQVSEDDAILDDKYIVDFVKDKKCITLIEEFGEFNGNQAYTVDLSIFKQKDVIRQKRVNTLNVYSTYDIEVESYDVEQIPRINDTSFVKLIYIKDK